VAIKNDFELLFYVRHELRPNESAAAFCERSGLTAAKIDAEKLTRFDISMILRSREELAKKKEEEFRHGTR